VRANGWSWAIFFVRWVLGMIFLMAGWWKVFTLGAHEHAQRMFVDGFSATWIPEWLLWTSGTSDSCCSHSFSRRPRRTMSSVSTGWLRRGGAKPSANA